MAPTEQEQPAQGVRFSEVNEEIEPDQALKHVATLTGAGDESNQELSPEAQEELRNLSMSLQKSRCQAKRMENFSFEPVSLPASRVSRGPPSSQFAADAYFRHRLRLRHRGPPRDTRASAAALACVHPLLYPRCIPRR